MAPTCASRSMPSRARNPNVGRHMLNDGDLVDLFAQMAPEPALQHKILVDNPARLYGF